MAIPPRNPRGADPEARTEVAPVEGARAAHVTSPESAPSLIAGRYEILGMLGAGGMGTVYRARDRELDETVALKVLKKELAAAAGMLERFRREVKLARRVTHNNVARTFDIGDHDGDRFLTMELIEGEMLGAHLARRGRMPLRDVIAIGRDLCSGLSAAHAAGVLHRDLKPENVIIARDGRAVITDFGIARAFSQGELGRTASGGVVGTPAYMAPEQVEGASDLDARADLYALGTMLFELLTGKVAWPGDSVISIAAGRLLRPPPDVRAHVPDLPEAAANLVLKLMARVRAERFATADETSVALSALVTAADLPSARSPPPASTTLAGDGTERRARRRTIAVLPLVNLGDDDDAYLAQTVTEDLVDLLSVVPELRVRPRGETSRFDQRTRDVREAGRALDVDVVVDGSLQRLGDDVRVLVRLITVEDGFQVWARRFDRPPAAVLNVADEAAAAIARALATEPAAAARPAPIDPVAQELYLRGRYLLHRGWFDAAREGVKLLREAHERAPRDTRIAGTYALAAARMGSTDPDAFGAAADARRLAERTLELDPLQSEARVALGLIHLNEPEGAPAAAIQLERALSTWPNSLEALDVLGRVLVEIGRTDLGIAMLRRALAIEPMKVQATHSIARTYALLGDFDGARDVLGPLPEHRADVTPHLFTRARIAMWRGDNVAAEAITRDIGLRPEMSEEMRRRVLAVVQIAKTRSLPTDLMADLDGYLSLEPRFPARRISFYAQMRAELKIATNDIEGALSDLRTADANGLLDLLWIDRCPVLDRLRDHPELIGLRRSTAGRAERVIRVLDS